MSTARSRRGPRVIEVDLPAGSVKVYANARIADALEELTSDMTLYHGVRLAQLAEAIYQQGVRDGRNDVFIELQEMERRSDLKHRNPGRPRKR